MAPDGSPGLGKASPGMQGESPRMPEVLLVCLLHDSAALRSRWSELAEGALGPLFCALSALQRDSRLLVGGVLYRSEPSGDMDALLRPSESMERIPFLPAPRFCARVGQALQDSSALQLVQLDETGGRACPLADSLAASLEMLDARDSPQHIAPFARAALRANFSPVLAKHFVHVVALDTPSDALPMRITPLQPVLNTNAAYDALDAQALVARLNERPVTIATVLSAKGGSHRARASLARTAHDLLCTRPAADNVSAKELFGTQWKMPEHLDILVSGAEVARELRKHARAPSEAPRTKRTRSTDSPMNTAALAPSAKVDQAALSKVLLLQQQQSTMLKNLGQIAAAQGGGAGAGTHLQGQMLEQIRQQRTYPYSRSPLAARGDQDTGRAAAPRQAVQL